MAILKYEKSNWNYVTHKPKTTLGQMSWVKGSIICFISLSPPFHNGAQFKIADTYKEPSSSKSITRANDRWKASLWVYPCSAKTESFPCLLYIDMYKFYFKEQNRSKPLKQFEFKGFFGHPETSIFRNNFWVLFSFNNHWLEILPTRVTEFMIQNVPQNWLLYQLKIKDGQIIAHETMS